MSRTDSTDQVFFIDKLFLEVLDFLASLVVLSCDLFQLTFMFRPGCFHFFIRRPYLISQVKQLPLKGPVLFDKVLDQLRCVCTCMCGVAY